MKNRELFVLFTDCTRRIIKDVLTWYRTENIFIVEKNGGKIMLPVENVKMIGWMEDIGND